MVTDSYHGTIFSLNFRKNVMSFDKRDGIMYDNGRIMDVLSSYGIESHYLKDYDEYIPEDIDFDKIKVIMEDNRNKSFVYLENIIG